MEKHWAGNEAWIFVSLVFVFHVSVLCGCNFWGGNHYFGPVVLICIMNEFESEDFRDLNVPELGPFIHTDLPSAYLVPGSLLGPASQMN